MEIHSFDSAPHAGPPIDLILRGKTSSPRALLGRFLISLFVVGCIIGSALPAWKGPQGQNSSISTMILFLAVMLFSAARNLWKQWRYPPLLAVGDEQLKLQLPGILITTPLHNIDDVFMSGGKLCLRFRDMRAVVSSNGSAIRKAKSQQGESLAGHLGISRGVFDLSQSNALRQVLGLPGQERDGRDESLSDFSSELKRATPRTWVTIALLVINIGVFAAFLVAEAMTSQSSIAHVFSNVSPDLVLKWGGNFAPLTANGQPWRLLTSVFIHWTLIHLIFNMWILYDIGRLVERILGNLPYLVVYLFSGFCGSLATVYWSYFRQPNISAGASGAVFGLFGLMLGLLLRRRRDFPAEILSEHRASCLGFLGFNLIFGLTMPNVDMAAHVGGLIGGFLCGLIAMPILPPRAIPSVPARLALVAPLCVCLTIAAVVFLPRPPVSFLFELDKFLATERQLVDRYRQITSASDSRQTPTEIAETIQRDVVTRWRQEHERLQALTNLQPEDRAAGKVLVTYAALREEGFDLIAQAIGEEDLAKQQKAVQKLDEAQRTLEDWVNTDGKRFGLSMSRRN